MFYHEFGHTIQSRLLGNTYLPLVAVPSLFGAAFGKLNDHQGLFGHKHRNEWYETFANQQAHHYLVKYYEKTELQNIEDRYGNVIGWDYTNYPLSFHLDWYWLFAHP